MPNERNEAIPNHEDNHVLFVAETDEQLDLLIAECFVAPGATFPRWPDQVNEKEFPVLDFQLIIPMPDVLNGGGANFEIVATQEEADAKNAEYAAQWTRTDVPNPFATEKYLSAAERDRRLMEYGALDWYTWAIQNWGTKWGAYEHSEFRRGIVCDYVGGKYVGKYVDKPALYVLFQTAWSQPTPVLEKLNQREGIAVHCITFDEGGFDVPDFGDPHEYMSVVRSVDVWGMSS